MCKFLFLDGVLIELFYLSSEKLYRACLAVFSLRQSWAPRAAQRSLSQLVMRSEDREKDLLPAFDI